MPQNRFYRLSGEVTISTEPMCGYEDWRLRALFCNAASIWTPRCWPNRVGPKTMAKFDMDMLLDSSYCAILPRRVREQLKKTGEVVKTA